YTSTSSNHLILTTSWTFPNAYSKPQRLHTRISRRIFNYKATSTDQWSEFSEHCSNLFIQHNIPLSIDTQENINTTWYKIQYCIIQAAIHTISNKISRKRSYNHKYTSHCTALHTGLKKLGHLIKTIKNHNNLYLPHINSYISLIKSYTK
ncbi:19502_t:CDS:1, partial [Gigaspora margarita]